MRPSSYLLGILLSASSVIAGCAHDPPRTQEPIGAANLQASSPPPDGKELRLGQSVGVSAELARVCNLHFDDVGTAPKFAFDQSDLSPADRSLLEQVTTCVVSGPLKGRAIHLVGRADARGEGEYNLALGSLRASAVQAYLRALGLDASRVTATSRGEIDATGNDESGWAQDRRVDVVLR